jgi:uncharacterized metal-binding protein YceD (DUF177 family)
VNVTRLPPLAARYEIEANAAERAALARRFGLISLPRLTADVRLRRLRGSVYEMNATLEAIVVQECSISLEPFEAAVRERFTLEYRPEADPSLPPVEDLEDIEFLSGDSIDIGEAVAQQLSLSIDPYPRAPGAVLEIGEVQPE